MKMKLGKVYEEFVERISEGSENDIDFIDTAARVLGKTGEYFGNQLITILRRNIQITQLYYLKIQEILNCTVTKIRERSSYHVLKRHLRILLYKLIEALS